MMRILKLNAKCRDLCFAEYEVDGKTIVESDGYAPDFPNICGGDYVDISIDLDTGQIVGFKPISHDDVMKELTDDEWYEDDGDQYDYDQDDTNQFGG